MLGRREWPVGKCWKRAKSQPRLLIASSNSRGPDAGNIGHLLRELQNEITSTIPQRVFTAASTRKTAPQAEENHETPPAGTWCATPGREQVNFRSATRSEMIILDIIGIGIGAAAVVLIHIIDPL